MITDRYAQLKALHLHGMAAAWQEWQAEGNSRQKSVMPEVWLDRLIAAEQTDRKARSLNYQLHAARFPHHRDLIHFDWAENPLTRERSNWPTAISWSKQTSSPLSAVPEPVKPIWQSPWQFRLFTRKNVCDSIMPLTWSTCWKKKNS